MSKAVLLFLMAFVIMIDLYFAQRSSTKRPEIFYLVAALMLFGAFLVTGGIG
jgi:hypothetical protein